MTHPYYLGGAQQILCYKVSSKIHGWGSRSPLGPLLAPWTKTHPWGSRGTPDPLYTPSTPGVLITGSKNPRTFPPGGPPLCQISSQSVQLFGFQYRTKTDIHCPLFSRLINREIAWTIELLLHLWGTKHWEIEFIEVRYSYH